MYAKVKTFCYLNPRLIHLSALLCIMAISIMASPVSANTIGDMGDNIANQFSGLTNAVKMFAFFAGFALVVVSVVLFAGMKKPGNQTPAAVPIIMLIAGIVLVSIMAFIQMGSTSLFGSDESSGSLSELGL